MLGIAPSALWVPIEVLEWRRPDLDLIALDDRIHQAEDLRRGPVRLLVRGARADPESAAQIRLRWQRLAPAENAASASELFREALRRHRAVHDLTQPLVRADFDRAVDTWQWVLRLSTAAGAATQIAALFLGVEQLATGVRDVLGDLEPETVERAADLVAGHERPADGDAELLADADALSFFALDSAGYLRRFGPDQTVERARWAQGRMTRRARRRLASIRMEPLIASAAMG